MGTPSFINAPHNSNNSQTNSFVRNWKITCLLIWKSWLCFVEWVSVSCYPRLSVFFEHLGSVFGIWAIQCWCSNVVAEVVLAHLRLTEDCKSRSRPSAKLEDSQNQSSGIWERCSGLSLGCECWCCQCTSRVSAWRGDIGEGEGKQAWDI